MSARARARPSRPMPEGTVTFLFSDVEGSTQLLERHGAGMGRALARHHAIFERVVAQHGGTIFETVGDAVYAVFPQASEAVAAATDAHRALAAEDWEPVGRIAVRIAVHTGEVDRRGEHYFGAALFRAARLQALGHGEQTLLSRVTAELAAGGLAAGVTLRDLGSHRLKDLGEPERVFQVVHPELRAEFPPLKSLDAHPHNLPLQLSSFIGRERELAELEQLLRESRLVTLLGPGGIGKTRLALQAAADQVERFADGVFFIDLAPLRDPELVLPAIASTFGLREQPGQAMAQTLAEHLASQAILLVLDNLEQLLPAAGRTVAELLGGSAGLRVIVTSRAPLRIRGEREYRVAPLAAGWMDQREPILPAAVELFLARGRALDPTFEVTDETGPLIAEICARADGLPLAIELAAARLRAFTLEQLHARLTRRLPLLAGGAHDLPERHQTLRHAIAWSDELLSAPERTLLRWVGIFSAGFTLDAAEAVTGPVVLTDVVDGITALLEASLLRRIDVHGSEARYGMLETIREYALERLEDEGELRAAQESHASYFRELVLDAAGRLELPEGLGAQRRLQSEWPNISAALAAYGDRQDWASVAAIGGQLGRFWRPAGNFAEGRKWLEMALAHEAELSASVLADAYWSLGNTAYGQGDYGDAHRCFRRELELARELRDRHREVRASLDLAGALMFAGRYEEVEGLHRDAIAAAADLGNLALLERARHNLGRFLGLHAGRYEEAVELLSGVRSAAASRGDAAMLAYALVNLGEVANRHGQYADARPLLEEGRKMAVELENRHLLAGAELDLGETEVALGNIEVGVRWLSSALRAFVEMGEKAGVVECVEHLAFAASESGDHARAAVLLAAADRLRGAIPVGYRPRRADAYNRARVRASDLSRSELDEASLRGSEMRFDEIVTYALHKPSRDDGLGS